MIAADCSAVVASASWAAVRSSWATSPSAPIDERVCTTSALRRASRMLVRRISRSATSAKAATPTIASRPPSNAAIRAWRSASAASAWLLSTSSSWVAWSSAIGPVTVSSSSLSVLSAAFGRARSSSNTAT